MTDHKQIVWLQEDFNCNLLHTMKLPNPKVTVTTFYIRFLQSKHSLITNLCQTPSKLKTWLKVEVSQCGGTTDGFDGGVNEDAFFQCMLSF